MRKLLWTPQPGGRAYRILTWCEGPGWWAELQEQMDAGWGTLRILGPMRDRRSAEQLGEAAASDHARGLAERLATSLPPLTPLVIPERLRRLERLITGWIDMRLDGVGRPAYVAETSALLAQFRKALLAANLDLDSEPAAVAEILAVWVAEGRPQARRQIRIPPATFNQRLIIISSFYAYAIRSGMLTVNPTKLVAHQPRDSAEA